MQVNDALNSYNNQISQNLQSHGTAETSPSANVGQAVKAALNELSNLPVGSVFEGSINSVKDGVVTLGLSNGQSISAKLDNGVNLTSGETLFFEVKSNTSGQIAIRPYSGNIMGNPILQNALESAGLTVNGKNLSMVHSMMNESMPIDKASLQQMARTIASLPDTEVATAVSMQKLGIPVNETNIAQFINYSTDKYEIMTNLNQLMESLPKALEAGNMSMNELVDITNGMLEIFAEDANAKNQAAVSQNTEAAVLNAANRETNEAQIPGAVNGESGEVQNLQAAQNEAAGLPANGEVINLAEQSGGKVENAAKEAAQMNENQTINQAVNEEATGNVTNPEGKTEVSSPAQNGQNPVQGEANLPVNTANTLTNEETANLSKMLSDITGKEYLGENDLSEMPPEKIMQEIKQALKGDAPLNKLAKLAGSREFQKLFTETLDKAWTVKPEELKEKDKVSELYNKMDKQLGKLEELLSDKSEITKNLNQIVKETRSNISFMNDVNQAYTFVQIPLKMSGQNVNSELYVMTNKKKLMNPENEVTAYLHLDMENLGSTDVFIKMLKKNVTTNFFLEYDKSYELIEKNLPALKERLDSLGYNTTLNIKNDKKDISFVEDFLKNEEPSPSNRVHRYSFDVRT